MDKKNLYFNFDSNLYELKFRLDFDSENRFFSLFYFLLLLHPLFNIKFQIEGKKHIHNKIY